MSREIRRVTVSELDTAVQQTLTLWHQDVNDGIDAAAEDTAIDLVRRTKATAPVGRRHGKYKRQIAYKEINKRRGKYAGKTYVWYVKAPDYRLTHLLVHGHAKKDGGRTKANPFLANAIDQVTPEFEERIKEVLQNGG